MNQKYVWDGIAESWHRHRSARQEDPMINEFLSSAKGNVLDLGCGSGKSFIKIDGMLFGADFSGKMLLFAKAKAKKEGINACLIKADASELPFRDSAFDAVLSAYVLHCTEKRGEILKELKRVMNNNASALVSVWNRRQPRFFLKGKESFVPWRTGGNTYFRYYYLYTKSELKKTLESAGFEIMRIEGSKKKAFKLFPKNIIAIVRKR